MVVFYTNDRWPKFNRKDHVNADELQGSLIIFCGIPGSGKTTIARIVARKRGRAVHIQTDTIRSMVGYPMYMRGESKFVYRSVTAVAGEALKAGYDAILDGTYLREDFREEPITSLAGLYKTKLAIHVSCGVILAYERNLSRPEKVPKESFLRLYSHFQSPRDALRIDTDRTTPEQASEAILMQVGRLRSLEREGRPRS